VPILPRPTVHVCPARPADGHDPAPMAASGAAGCGLRPCRSPPSAVPGRPARWRRTPA